jgi:two-component system LytT family response regulator
MGGGRRCCDREECVRRVLIADDEPLALSRLRRLLDARPDCQIVAECEDGVSAVDALATTQPDIAFIDIRMPGMDGLEVIEILRSRATSGEGVPAIVFVTAFDEYAVPAFRSDALHYLLKPIDDDGLDAALARYDQRRGKAPASIPPVLLTFLETLRQERSWVQRFVIRGVKGAYFVSAEDVDWAEAYGNYVRLHTGREVHLLRETMSAFTEKVDPLHFLRIHRSYVVNVDRIARLSAHEHAREYLVVLRDGTRLRSSRSYAAAIRQLIG